MNEQLKSEQSGSVEPDPLLDVIGVRRKVDSYPVFGRDHSCRGHVRLDLDRIGHANQTEFCITIGCNGYLSPYEARQYAARLLEVADHAELRIGTRS